MHSFHHSRGRILFEVVCALVVSASCAGAWLQTGAWALLPGAAAALLYGVVHALDLVRRQPTVEVESAGVSPEPAHQDAGTASPVQEAEPVEPPAPPKPKRKRQAKAPRKGGGRSSVEEAKATGLHASGEIDVSAPVVHEEPKVVAAMPLEVAAHPPVTPLFEPEPFVRQQRAVFGRKAG